MRLPLVAALAIAGLGGVTFGYGPSRPPRVLTAADHAALARAAEKRARKARQRAQKGGA